MSVKGSGTSFTAVGPNPASNIYMTIAGKYAAGSSVYAYLNGSAGSPVGTAVAPTGFATWSYIGSNYTTPPFYDGPIQRVMVYSSALSDTDVTTVTNAVKDGP